MEKSQSVLEISDRGSTRYLTLNRPERRNALSWELLKSLGTAQEALKKDLSVRVVVVSGAGDVFSSGHDLKEMEGKSEADMRELFQFCSAIMLGFQTLPQPVIARVHGVATAAGCQLACSADLIVASHDATFATPGVQIGLFCTTPMVPLVRSLPKKVALEMLFTSKPLSAQRAFDLGLVNRVVAEGELDSAVEQLAQSLARFDARTLATGKSAFYAQIALDEAAAYRAACPVMSQNAVRDDAVQGIRGFLGKRERR
jgi:enoyl-CoA hydratase/carnithine racemase